SRFAELEPDVLPHNGDVNPGPLPKSVSIQGTYGSLNLTQQPDSHSVLTRRRENSLGEEGRVGQSVEQGPAGLGPSQSRCDALQLPPTSLQ
ncbi:hypothetical protein DBR06_SOUSAS38010008, partial [Sousa chinensis]